MQRNDNTIHQLPTQSPLATEAQEMANRLEAVANMIQALGDPDATCDVFEDSDAKSAYYIGRRLMQAAEVWKALSSNCSNPEIKVAELDLKDSTKGDIERSAKEKDGADLGGALEEFADLFIDPARHMFFVIMNRYESEARGEGGVYQSAFFIDRMLGDLVQDSDNLLKRFCNHWSGQEVFKVA
ncbi:hypothetical protein GCM10007160_16860 [Litchfieldella qijiaojingensis]|uniref:Uncharacterized protein n=1 Tax=Litchfieldella qijiaojingensis TaxID=980347 RepID=A0ABQ2YNB0_9GAMM|nr:hypothetical protein [Halomonas qijiaojingensis]GGX90038.1 hypothetical protein GCM10007160_16860 [Halomonas qijiaojingensis]